MITNKGIAIKASDCIDEINFKLSRLRDVLIGASNIKKEEDVTEDMMTFSPAEWENIAISIQHYQMAMNELKRYKRLGDDREIDDWFDRHTPFLGYLRDMVCAWYDRLPPRSEA